LSDGWGVPNWEAVRHGEDRGHREGLSLPRVRPAGKSLEALGFSRTSGWTELRSPSAILARLAEQHLGPIGNSSSPARLEPQSPPPHQTPRENAMRPGGPMAFSHAPGWIRTSDLMLRRHALYPTELRARWCCKTGKLTSSGLGLHHCGGKVRSPFHVAFQSPTNDSAPAALSRTGAEKWSARNKPSSVPSRGRIIPLGPPLPTASSSLPGTQVARAAPRPLFGLAPSGVCRATSVASGPVRSYRTLSPLPVPLSRPSAVCFLWHFPSSSRTPGRYPAPCPAELGLSSHDPWITGDPHSPRSMFKTPAETVGFPGAGRPFSAMTGSVVPSPDPG
jgi:hypothetical protein